ncbi:hypothetical protein [Gloeothece verrucosa]|uniref:Uncharacterized protein n=1 Tax=Gloeothece verrucosa (strain PCC 7822) TaxID=497965 RepID=E0UN41_GLOV7|nr:hypothetical protein [Gloeothece verrucosa]ADN18371.1 hypothetical protein Cyan7822_6619 [Gloeothece verrucosa PCC 7822]
MTNPPVRLIKKQSSVTDSSPSQTEALSSQGNTTGEQFTTGDEPKNLPDSDELDLSTIKLPPDFEAKLEAERAANSFTPPASVPIAVVHGGGNPLNEIKADFLLDGFQEFGDEEFWDVDSDLRWDLATLSSDYVDFLLSYE